MSEVKSLTQKLVANLLSIHDIPYTSCTVRSGLYEKNKHIIPIVDTACIYLYVCAYKP